MPDIAGRLHYYSGLDVAHDSAYGWFGVGIAPFDLMDREGFRLRLQGGGGRYRYRTDVVPGGWNTATDSEGEALAGWQWLPGTMAVALYGGLHIANDTLDMPDPDNPDQGTHVGAKGIVELFARPAEGWTATASTSFSTVNTTFTARATLARQLTEKIALGTEASTYADRRAAEGRWGLFAATVFGRHTITLAGGWRLSDDGTSGAYGTLSLFAPF